MVNAKPIYRLISLTVALFCIKDNVDAKFSLVIFIKILKAQGFLLNKISLCIIARYILFLLPSLPTSSFLMSHWYFNNNDAIK